MGRYTWIIVVSFANYILTQHTEAQCPSFYQWMNNNLNQTPCLVAAYLESACSLEPADTDIRALRSGLDEYNIPAGSGNVCVCNTVFYSLISACTLCQDVIHPPLWSVWKTNCTTASVIEFPTTIPSGTLIPPWAYQDVTTSDIFNLTVAEARALTDKGDILPSSTFNFVSTVTVITTVTPPVSNSGLQGGQRHITAIATGSAVGGAVFLLLVSGLIAELRRRYKLKKGETLPLPESPPNQQHGDGEPRPQDPEMQNAADVPASTGAMGVPPPEHNSDEIMEVPRAERLVVPSSSDGVQPQFVQGSSRDRAV